MSVLLEIPLGHGTKKKSQVQGVGAHTVQKVREVLRENHYAGNSGRQEQGGEDEHGRRRVREDKIIAWKIMAGGG